MRGREEYNRGRHDCPRDGCEKDIERVEERVVEGRKALVYWHDEFERYCIEYPDGETSVHTRDRAEEDRAVR